MDWFRVEVSHSDMIAAAFDRIKDIRASRQVSYLANPAILDFHRDRTIQQIKQQGCSLWAASNNNRLVALIGTSPSNWHSEHYGFPIYKVHPFFTFDTNEHSLCEFVRESKDSVFYESSSLFMMRTDAADTELNYTLSREPFPHVGTSVRFVLDEKRLQEPRQKPSTGTDVRIRDFLESDLPSVQSIAADSHSHSHFFNEPRFAIERTKNLFAEWVRKCANGIAAKFWVAETGDTVAGFCIALKSGALKPYIDKTIGVIDFIVVNKKAQGKGIGRALLDTSLDWFRAHCDLVELRTMADNLSAIRFYEANGFRLLSADQHFHIWTESKK